MSSQMTLGRFSATSENDSLLVALFIAAVVHILVLFGTNFMSPKPEKVSRTIEVTLANTPAPKAPKKASFLAQDNQIGAGEKITKPVPPKQKLASSPAVKPSPVPVKTKPPKSQPKEAATVKKIIATTKPAEVKITQKEAPVEEDATPAPTPHISASDLQQQITQLGTEIRQKQQSADLSKIKHVNSVSTHKYVAAQYMKDWENKVERTGNLNYPEEASKKNFYGKLTMEVGIKPDGTIYNIRIKQSSGNVALDEAAKRIVRISEPFPPLPKELLQELDVLVITRVWQFSDKSGMTSH
jgi:periplasmic protein TonB